MALLAFFHGLDMALIVGLALLFQSGHECGVEPTGAARPYAQAWPRAGAMAKSW